MAAEVALVVALVVAAIFFILRGGEAGQGEDDDVVEWFWISWIIHDSSSWT